MSIKTNLGLVYLLLPYISPVKNKFGLAISIIFNFSKYKLKLKDNLTLTFKSSEFEIMLNLLGVLTLAISYSIKSKTEISFTFDTENHFSINTGNLSYSDQNLLELLFLGIKYGANFVTNKNLNLADCRDKTVRILDDNGKKIVETSDGIKFFLDSMHPGNTIIETYVRDIHNINSNHDYSGQIIIDVGAECGDTPLYYANKGAKVYAFEPIPEHFDAMLKNIELNPHLSERIIPINSGIGKDGNLTFYQSQSGIVGNTSFVTNLHGGDAKKITAKCYSIKSVLEEFKIEHVDLLKMDCKGCETFLTKEDLEKVHSIKIEYFSSFENKNTLQDMLNILENVGFNCMTYSGSPDYHNSLLHGTNIFGKK